MNFLPIFNVVVSISAEDFKIHLKLHFSNNHYLRTQFEGSFICLCCTYPRTFRLAGLFLNLFSFLFLIKLGSKLLLHWNSYIVTEYLLQIYKIGEDPDRIPIDRYKNKAWQSQQPGF